MPTEILNEREFELINILGAALASSQRDLSRKMELSLGMTNMLVRRLIAKGYIRINQLNKRKVSYILTPKGFSEKMRKSISYTHKTILSIGLIKNSIKELVSRLYEAGERDFFIMGRSDLALLVELAFREMKLVDYRLVYLDEVPPKNSSGALLLCKEDVTVEKESNLRVVNLLGELAKDNSFIGNRGRTLEHVK